MKLFSQLAESTKKKLKKQGITPQQYNAYNKLSASKKKIAKEHGIQYKPKEIEKFLHEKSKSSLEENFGAYKEIGVRKSSGKSYKGHSVPIITYTRIKVNSWNHLARLIKSGKLNDKSVSIVVEDLSKFSVGKNGKVQHPTMSQQFRITDDMPVDFIKDIFNDVISSGSKSGEAFSNKGYSILAVEIISE